MMNKKNVRLPLVTISVFCIILSILVLLVSAPAISYAQSYSVENVDINASVESNGTLDVSETRTFSFNGSFNGVYWVIDPPQGSTLSVSDVSKIYKTIVFPY